MLRKALLTSIAVVLILVVAGSSVFAQGGGGDKFVFGESFVLRSGQVLDGNLAVLGGSATLERGSTVRGDVAIAGGRLVVGGTVEGSAAVFGGTAVLEDTAIIEGDFASLGGTIERAPGAVIRGESFTGLRPKTPSDAVPELPELPELPVLPKLPSPARGPFGGLGDVISWQFATIGSALMMILLGALALLVAPKHMGRIASAAAAQPALNFGAGLLTFVVGLLVGTLLLIACCLGLFVWLALAVAVIVGWIAIGLWFGQRLLAALKVRDASSLVEVALGVFLITIIGRLPWCIGFLFSAVIGSIGLGAVVLTRFGRQPLAGASGEPSVPRPQSLEDLDVEVLAPLGLPAATLTATELESREPEVPAAAPSEEPVGQTVEGAPVIQEPPSDPVDIVLPGSVDGALDDREPEQPAA